MDLSTLPDGTPHTKATCCWCGRKLVSAHVQKFPAWLCPVDYPRQIKHALLVKAHGKAHAKLIGGEPDELVCVDVPLPAQVGLEDATEKYVLWGSRAGPGKSHGVRKWLYRRSLKTPNHESLLLRENWEQLEKTHIRAMQREVPLLGGEFANRTAKFPNGSVIDCGHMADSEAVQRYLSTNYGAIVPEEAALYPVDPDGVTPLAELTTRSRVEYPDLKGEIVKPRFVCVTNPGGPSAQWLREMFIDHAPDLERYPKLATAYRPEQWVYLPAKLTDNPYVPDDYEDVVLANLNATRYKQLAEGDWYAFSGQFFSQWHEGTHVQDWGTPSNVTWVRSLDWGHNAPGCVLWWALLPDHRFYCRAELKFQRMDESEVAAAIKKMDAMLGIRRIGYTVGDPSVFNKTGATHRAASGFIGQSIGETLGYYGIPIIGADNDRINGWKRCHSLLRLAPDGKPWMIVHPDCTYLRRSIASARSEPRDPDDVDTKSDDHALDSWRYFSLSRPSPSRADTRQVYPEGTMGWYRMRAMREGTQTSRLIGRVA